MEDLDTPRCTSSGSRRAFCARWRPLDCIATNLWYIKASVPLLMWKPCGQLQSSNAVYPCCCTRKEIADSAMYGIEGLVYPGNCRDGIPAGHEGRAWRVRTNAQPSPFSSSLTPIEFDDALQGHINQNLKTEIGDFVVKRADGLFAYQLAVVVDDAFQGITNVVRGADLLMSTPRQIYLQRLLGLTTLAYMHLPVAVNEAGEKLSKQTLATPVNESQVVLTLLRVLDFLQLQPNSELTDYVLM
jgi:glutamyl-Q tRNA(Asp) synthetase